MFASTTPGSTDIVVVDVPAAEATRGAEMPSGQFRSSAVSGTGLYVTLIHDPIQEGLDRETCSRAFAIRRVLVFSEISRPLGRSFFQITASPAGNDDRKRAGLTMSLINFSLYS